MGCGGRAPRVDECEFGGAAVGGPAPKRICNILHVLHAIVGASMTSPTTSWRDDVVDALCAFAGLAAIAGLIGFGYFPQDGRSAARVATLLCRGIFGVEGTLADYASASWMLVPSVLLLVLWMRTRGTPTSRAAVMAAAMWWVCVGWYCQVGAFV